MNLNYEQINNMLNTISWPFVALITILVLRKPLIKLLNRLSSADEVNMSVGSLSVQAKAMRELYDYIGVGFTDNVISKKAIESLIDTKIRSIQAAIEYEATKSEVRNDPRIVKNEQIKIIKENGDEFDGIMLDTSDAGIGFKSYGRLSFHETVQIKPYENITEEEVNSFWDKLHIVRIEQSSEDEGFYYGATVPIAA